MHFAIKTRYNSHLKLYIIVTAWRSLPLTIILKLTTPRKAQFLLPCPDVVQCVQLWRASLFTFSVWWGCSSADLRPRRSGWLSLVMHLANSHVRNQDKKIYSDRTTRTNTQVRAIQRYSISLGGLAFVNKGGFLYKKIFIMLPRQRRSYLVTD